MTALLPCWSGVKTSFSSAGLAQYISKRWLLFLVSSSFLSLYVIIHAIQSLFLLVDVVMRQIPFVVFRLSFSFNIVTLWSVTLGLFLFDKQTNHFAFSTSSSKKIKKEYKPAARRMTIKCCNTFDDALIDIPSKFFKNNSLGCRAGDLLFLIVHLFQSSDDDEEDFDFFLVFSILFREFPLVLCQ